MVTSLFSQATDRGVTSKPDFSATDRTPDCAEYPQHDSDHNEDSAEGVQDRDTCEVTDQQKDYT
jgi:hypothetical protein